jgi:hypothetical protein
MYHGVRCMRMSSSLYHAPVSLLSSDARGMRPGMRGILSRRTGSALSEPPRAGTRTSSVSPIGGCRRVLQALSMCCETVTTPVRMIWLLCQRRTENAAAWSVFEIDAGATVAASAGIVTASCTSLVVEPRRPLSRPQAKASEWHSFVVSATLCSAIAELHESESGLSERRRETDRPTNGADESTRSGSRTPRCACIEPPAGTGPAKNKSPRPRSVPHAHCVCRDRAAECIYR